ncbi:MAG: lipoyl synthase [Caldithrix sp.]|nr:MAG: lipoyl synthase [Caldithrix sp.]
MLNSAVNSKQRSHQRRPDWLKVRLPFGEGYNDVKRIVENGGLHTVCQEARCPNIAECWERRTATLMILGDVCTRSCGFCAVKTGKPLFLDLDEPRRVGEAVKKMGLKHAVITSVNRDELADGGAAIFAETIRQIRLQVPGCKVEVLIPDFKGDSKAQKKIIDSGPDILNHNTETVPRLYQRVRPQGRYEWTLNVLQFAKQEGMITKSGMMLGLGESTDEILKVMSDLRRVKVNILTLGQYLQPTKNHLPVGRYVHPDEFAMLKEEGMKMGFSHVESGPLVRSSYHADEHV